MGEVRVTRFVVVGAGAAALLFLLSFVLVSAGLPPFEGTLVAYTVAFGVAYWGPHRWTFDSVAQHRSSLPRYAAVQVGCAIGSGAVSHIVVATFGLPPLVMSIAATLAASLISFALSAMWVFRRPTDF